MIFISSVMFCKDCKEIELFLYTLYRSLQMKYFLFSSARHQNAVALVKQLSPRQREILTQMAAGFRTKQIAYQLSLSEKTVQMHRMLMFKKLATSNAADAVRIAVEAGL